MISLKFNLPSIYRVESLLALTPQTPAPNVSKSAVPDFFNRASKNNKNKNAAGVNI